MTSVVTVQPPRRQIKPARSLTHPLRETTRGSKKGEHLDPNELSRRLEAHIMEQKLEKERRRIRYAKKEAEAAVGRPRQPYHHVPRVAATDMIKTATQEGMPKTNGKGGKQIHVLAREALRQQNDTIKVEGVCEVGTSAVHRTQAADAAIVARQQIYDRNQFTRDTILEDAARYDRERDIYAPPKRTFGVDPLALFTSDLTAKVRPMSMGDLHNWEPDYQNLNAAFGPHRVGRPHSKVVPGHTANDRLDWAQRDDTPVEHRSFLDRLRKAESKRNLRRIDDDDWAREDETVGSLTAVGNVEMKNKKSGFFGQFRRKSRGS